MTEKQANLACLAVSMGLFAWGDWYPRPYGVCMAILITVPWLCLLAVIAVRRYRFGFMGILLFFPTLILGYRAFHDIHVLAWGHATLSALVLTAIYFALVCFGDRVMRKENWGWLLLLIPFVFTVYGYGTVLEIDTLLDSAVPRHFSTEVKRSYSPGVRGGTTYYLELGPWSDQPKTKEVITWDLYRSLRGQTVACIDVGPGRLGIPWYKVGRCP